ncbi:hypothetical protein [Haloarchaeobius sp. DFWS5]|uniref:hypothetical protein n=1 Tax=Haloarchaeobius sp. DFWS5 TaxID=3446114 RepID=UPI003EB93464
MRSCTVVIRGLLVEPSNRDSRDAIRELLVDDSSHSDEHDSNHNYDKHDNSHSDDEQNTTKPHY